MSRVIKERYLGKVLLNGIEYEIPVFAGETIEEVLLGDVGVELLEMGIAKEDIVLGLHPPYKRPYTGHGVA